MMRSISVSALERICLGIPWNFTFYETVRSANFKSSHHALLTLISLHKFTSSSPLIQQVHSFVHNFRSLHTCCARVVCVHNSNCSCISCTLPSTTMQHKFEILAKLTSFYQFTSPIVPLFILL
jgi:hypothetical protein